MPEPPKGGVTIHVQGLRPEPQPRPRTRPGSAGVYSPNSGRILAWKRHVVATAMAYTWWPTTPFSGALRVACVFFFPRPQYMYGPGWSDLPLPYVKTPDRDNLDKAVLDCLGLGRGGFKDRDHAGVWKDDKQVCQGPVEKWYVPQGERGGAVIHIRAATPWEERYGDGWWPWQKEPTT